MAVRLIGRPDTIGLEEKAIAGAPCIRYREGALSHPHTSDSLIEPGRQVDIDTSRHEGRIVACQGYDDTLDELNSRLEGMSDRYSSPDVV